MKFSLIGAGRAGKALATALQAAGYELAAVAGGRSEAAAAFAAATGACYCETVAKAAVKGGIVLLAVPDNAILACAREIAAEKKIQKEGVVLHVCGSQNAEVLSCLREAGAAVGSMHPLQSFSSDTAAGAACVRGTYFAVDGDEAAVASASDMIAALGGRRLLVSGAQRALYHAAACMASNYLAALLQGSVRLLGQCGISQEDALPALEPIVRATLKNIMLQGPSAALTGPIARGDDQTLVRQLKQIDELPEEAALYRALAEYTIAIVDKGGRLEHKQIELLKNAINS